MRDIMFDVPTNPKIEKCIITKDTVEKKTGPKLIINESKVENRSRVKKKATSKTQLKQGETA